MKTDWIVRAPLAVVGALLLSSVVSAQGGPPQTVSLTLADAVQRAIDHNPDLAVVRLATEVEAARVGESLSAFLPVFSTTMGRSNSVTPPTTSLVGDAGTDVHDWFSSTGVRQRLPWGAGTWSVSWDTARTTTNSPFSTFDPNLQSGVQLAFSQPLIKDRAIDAARQQYVISRRNRDSSELRVQEAVVQTVASVKQAYWTFKATVANVGVQQRSLELAEELARQNRIKVDAGEIAPLDLVQAESEVAARREGVIQARTSAGDAEDRLRRLIMDPGDRSFWRVALVAVEEPATAGVVPDADAAVAAALRDRHDLARAVHDLENTSTNVAFYQNQKLPDVRLEMSYRGNGLGGTQFLRTDGFPGTITGTRDRSLASALGQAFTPDYPAWSVGVTVSYPIGRSYEEASLARAQVERQQASRRIASLQLDVAATVRQALRRVQSGAERVDASRAAASLAEQRLTDEQRRFDVGLSTTFLVTQAQRDLLQAQVGLLQAMLDYESAMVNFEAVQRAPSVGVPESSGIQGAEVAPLPTSTPRGLFRTGVTGTGF